MSKIKELSKKEGEALQDLIKTLNSKQLLLLQKYSTARHLYEQEVIKRIFK